jgi:hypothetical protein
MISSSFSRCAACSARIARSMFRIRSVRSSLMTVPGTKSPEPKDSPHYVERNGFAVGGGGIA